MPIRLVRLVAEGAGLPPGDEEALLATVLFQFSFIAGAALLKAASYALLLFQVEDRRVLPALYVVSSLTAGGLALAQAIWRPSRRWPPSRTLMGWVAIFLLLSLLVLIFGPIPTVALYLFVELFTTTVSVKFWTQVAERFDLRAARRLLGLIGGIGMAGSILGGLVAQIFGAWVGALPLVALACLSPLACFHLAPAMMTSPDREAAERVPAPPTAKRAQIQHYLTSNTLPRSLGALALLLAAFSTASDYLFRFRARESMSDGEMAALFGGMSVAVGLVAMLAQLFFTGKLLRRIGLFGFVSIIPVLALIFVVASALSSALWPAYGLRMVEQIGSLALLQTGMQLLYGPVPDAMRGAVRSAVDGLAKKSGHAVVGVLLIVFVAGFEPRGPQLPWLIGGIIGLSLLILFRVRKDYIDALTERLRAPEPSFDHEAIHANATAQKVLKEALDGGEERGVLLALEILSRDQLSSLDEHLPRLLEHPSSEVKSAAVWLAAQRGAKECLGQLKALLESEDSNLQAAAISAIAQLDPEEAPAILETLLEHPETSTRVAAIAALLPLENAAAAEAMEAMLKQGGALEDEERVQAARMLGMLGPSRHAHRLRDYLRDPSLKVQRAACTAAGECRDPRLVPDLFSLLSRRDTQPEARSALVRYGDTIVPVVQSLLNDRHQAAELRYRLPRLLREIGTERAAEVILFSNVEDDPFLHYRLSVEVARLREKNPYVRIDAARAIDATSRRLSAYEQLLSVTRDLEAAFGREDLLVRALHDRLDQSLEAAFLLAGLVFPRRKVANAYNRFVGADASARPYAMEMLEHVLGDGLNRRFISVLERWHKLPDPGEGRLERVPARLMELIVSPDPVLRGIALSSARALALLRDAAQVEGEERSLERLAHLEAQTGDPMWQILLNAPLSLYEDDSMSEQVVQKMLFLETVDIFAESEVDDLAALARLLSERTYAAGEQVYDENDPGDAVFIIVEGQVRIEKDGRLLMHYGPRDSFGETSLLDGNPRPAAAIASSDLRVYVLERSDFMDLVADRVELLRGIFRAVTRHLRLVLETLAAGHPASATIPPPLRSESG